MSGKNLVLSLWPNKLSSNQIAGFFDHQYLWKESSDILCFLYGGNQQGEVEYEVLLFVGCDQLCLLSN